MKTFSIQTGQSRRTNGLLVVIVAVMAFFVLLPLSLLVFEIARLHVAQNQLETACDAAVLGAAAVISKRNANEEMALMQETGLHYFRMNSVCSHSLAQAQLMSNTNTAVSDGECIVSFSFDEQTQAVMASAELALDPAFGRFLGLGTYKIKSSSKAHAGSSEKLDIVIVLDTSGSMWNIKSGPGEPMRSAIRATQSFISEIQDDGENHFGLITYSTHVSGDPGAIGRLDDGSNQISAISPVIPIRLPRVDLSRSADNVSNVTESLRGLGATGSTFTGAALDSAMRMVSGPGHRDDAHKVIVLITDGEATDPSHALAVGGQFASQNIAVHSIGFFHDGVTTGGREFISNLTRVAGGQSRAYLASNIPQLSEALEEIRARYVSLIE